MIRLSHADIYLMFKTLQSRFDTFERIQNIHEHMTNTNCGKSDVDYVIGSIPLLCFCTEFYIGVQDFSDHSPVCCKLTFSDGVQIDIVKINSRNSLRFINKQVRQQRWKHLNTTGGTISAQTQNG